MLYLEYTHEGEPVNDFGLEPEFMFLRNDNHNNSGNIHQYSTENIFNRVRVGIVSGEISHENVVFIFKGQQFSPNKYGAIQPWPRGFCCLNGDLAEQILRGMMKIYKPTKDIHNE